MNKNLENQFHILFENSDKKFKEDFLEIQNKIYLLKQEIQEIENNIIKYQTKPMLSVSVLTYITQMYEKKLNKEQEVEEFNQSNDKLKVKYNQYLVKKKLMNDFFTKKRKEFENKKSKKEDQEISDIYSKVKNIFDDKD